MTTMIGQPAPDFTCDFYDRTKDDTDDQFGKVSLEDLRGSWCCLFFYPRDFTFVCPTELVAFNEKFDDFKKRNCVVYTASTDSGFSHKGWCDSHPQLAGLKYRMLADTTHALSKAYGVYGGEAGLAYRGVYLIDPNGVLRWMAVHDLSCGRNVDEVLRVLDALQTDKLTPCGWTPGDDTLS